MLCTYSRLGTSFLVTTLVASEIVSAVHVLRFTLVLMTCIGQREETAASEIYMIIHVLILQGPGDDDVETY